MTQTNTANAGARTFLWLSAITLLLIAGIVVYALTSDTPLSGGVVPVLTSDDHIKGNPEAEVVLVEYSDFECPACASFYPVVKDVVNTYGSSTAVVYRHFPLPQHSNAKLAAYAAEAAALQGKFWEMHDAIFDTQQVWSGKSLDDARAHFVSLASSTGLILEQFERDIESSVVEERVERDSREAQTLVNSTPTFFLNGEKLILRTFGDLLTQVEALINETPVR